MGFLQAWRKIKAEGAWTKWDWTVKVDIDAVFLPIRLRQYLGQVEVTDNGIYLETCKYVNYGFFGSCSVISHNAAATYMANLDDCKSSLNYMSSDDKDTGNQPWGEDLFQQRCMDCMASTRSLATTSTLMPLAQHGVQRARRRTANGSPIAPSPRPQQSTTSRHQSCTSTASRPLNVKLDEVNSCAG